MNKSQIQILPNPKQIQNPKSKSSHWDLEIGIYLVVLVLFVVLGFVPAGYAQSTSSSELINSAKQYDGKLVVYEGEAIGEVMQRGDYAWVNIHDGANAIGIWMGWAQAKEIVYTGSFKSRGDRIEVSGIFSRACPVHGGDLDIHAQAIRKLSAGRLIQERLNPAKKNQALILLGVLLIVWILTLFMRR